MNTKMNLAQKLNSIFHYYFLILKLFLYAVLKNERTHIFDFTKLRNTQLYSVLFGLLFHAY
jgi:hypothetical protein